MYSAKAGSHAASGFGKKRPSSISFFSFRATFKARPCEPAFLLTARFMAGSQALPYQTPVPGLSSKTSQ